MKTAKNTYKSDKKFYQIIAALFTLICMIIGVLSFQYYSRLQSTIKAESYGYMEEISNQISGNIDRIINDKYSMLGVLSMVLNNSNIETYTQLDGVIKDQQSYWHYQKLLLIDKNGVAYDEKGNTVVLNGDEYLQDVIVDKEASMSTSQVIGGKESIIFAIPVASTRIVGNDIVGIAISYELSQFDQLLAMTAFGGKGYAHIITKDGTAVVRSSSPEALQTGYNILSSLSDATIGNNGTIDKIKSEIANGKSGQSEITIGDTHEYMTYTPIVEQKWSLLTFVPVEVVNEKSSMMLNVTLLLCGFITLTFASLLAILMFTYYRNKKKLEQIAYVDPVTGGNTIGLFFELSQKILNSNSKMQHALIYTNVEKFKVLNDQFGRLACDNILRSIESGISSDLSENECVGRQFADNFCVLVEFENEVALENRFENWYKGSYEYMEKNGGEWLPLIMDFGVFIVENSTMPFAQMIDRAKLSLSEADTELHGKIRYAIYNEKVRNALFREKQLEDRMVEALLNREFQVYLQPKYNTQTEKVGGAEALVRWVTKSEGIIFPDEFIPLFEKNGFVIQLDFYMFEETCKNIRRWIDCGVTPVKVSVNCSRLHLKNTGFLQTYKDITVKYKIPRQFLEIELTENTVFEDVERLSEIIRQIHDAGFGCSMDDFGSGYSSLNLIQDIPVDTLKLDKIFFRNSRNMARSESVVGSIISMSKALSMETVAEGVEKREQVEMLKRLNCDFVQGFYFARPMPINEFEKLAFGKEIGKIANDLNL